MANSEQKPQEEAPRETGEEIDRRMLARAVGRAISKRRAAVGLTQEQMAERMGLGREAISRIERGVVIPNIDKLFQFAVVLDCEASELLSEAGFTQNDQEGRISGLLKNLNQADRKLVVDVVERLVDHLRKT